MSHVRTLPHCPNVPAALSRTKTFYGILFAATAAAVIASFTATVLSRSPATANEHDAASVPLAPAPSAMPTGTSVPEASTVFNGKDMPAEEPALTF